MHEYFLREVVTFQNICYLMCMEPVRKMPPPSLKDEQIIDSVLDGRKDDYELIMRRYNERLYRIGISIVKDDDEVEDLMQETYIKAYHQLKNFKRRSKFSTWLSRIMINESLAKLRQKKRFEQYSETEDDRVHSSPSRTLASNTETPEKQLLQKELNSILTDAIQTLPQKYQTVFMLREVERMSVQETAECLKISSENVKVRLHRAKELLKTNLKMISPEAEFFSFEQPRCDKIVDSVLRRIR